MQYSDWLALEKSIKKIQDKERFHHTLGVMNTAACLAMVHGVDIEKARLAGLLHDCAKCEPENDKKAAVCDELGVEITEFEREHPQLIHGKLGAYYAKHRYHVEDPEVCTAIAFHTTGRPDMSVLEQIIFIADYIEPDRKDAPRLDEIRKEAFRNLDCCTEMIMSDTLAYLNRKSKCIDDLTRKAYEFYHKKGKSI